MPSEKNQNNILIVVVMTIIAVGLSFFWYILTHATQVPYLGPIGG